MEIGTKAEQKLHLLSPGINRNPDLPKRNQVITLTKKKTKTNSLGLFFFFLAPLVKQHLLLLFSH